MKNLVLIFSFLFITLQLSAQDDWNTIPLPTTENLNEIQFVNDSVGFIIGEKGILLKTIDRGQNWNTINTPDTFNIISLAFISETEGGILMSNQFSQPFFYVTDNNGLNWQQKPYTQNGLCFPNVLFAVADKIIIGGNGCFYGDGISIFQNDTIVMDTMLNWFGTITQFDFIDENIGFASSTQASIYKTINGGFTWTMIPVSDSIVNIYDIAFQDEMNGYLVGLDTSESLWAPEVVFKTEDGGNTWNTAMSQLFVTPKFTDAAIYAEDSVIIVGAYNETFEDNGTVWYNFYEQDTTNFHYWRSVDTNSVKPSKNDVVVQNRCIYIIGDDGFLASNCYKKDTTIGSGINIFENENFEFKLFPNPATKYIEITIKDVPKGKYTFQILDISGKIVFSKLENIEAYFFKRIELNDLNNGLYFLRIINDEIFSSKTFQINK